MSEPENRTPESSELVEVKQQCAALHRQVVILVMAIFVVSGTLTVYLGVQARRLGKNLDAIRPQARQVMDASLREAPVINNFMVKLADYGRTHPDFAPIVAKYRLGTNAAASRTGTNMPAAAPKK
jgi:hypothetical protein